MKLKCEVTETVSHIFTLQHNSATECS